MSPKLAASAVIFICLLDNFQAVVVNVVDNFKPSQKLPNIFPNNIQKSRAIEYATRHDNNPIFNTRFHHHPYGLKVRKKVVKKIIFEPNNVSNERIMIDSSRRASQPKTAQNLMKLKNYRDLRMNHRQNLLSFNDKSKIIYGSWAPLLTPDPSKITWDPLLTPNPSKIPPTITTSVAPPPPKIVTAKNTTPLFINKRFALNEMFQQNTSKFAILCIRKPM